MSFRRVLLFALAWPMLQTSAWTQEAARTAAASAASAVPPLVPYSGTVGGRDGKPLSGNKSVTFLIYKEESGGEPLWVETQTVPFDSSGHYKAQLGAASPNGLPADLFASGEARWLEVQIEGVPAQARVLLASVPYAMKAGDAATLGGLPASAFALAGSQSAPIVAAPAGLSSNAASNVTTSGGVSGYLPLFNGTNTVVDSVVFQNTKGIGINDQPNGALDVNGDAIFRGPFEVARTGNATTTSGYPSNPFSLYSQAWSSAKSEGVGPFFSIQSEPTGNNTAAPGATLNLLYNNGLSTSSTETGLYFNPNGTINFSPRQTFPAATFTGPIATSTTAGNVNAISATNSGTDGVGIQGDGAGAGGYGVVGIANGAADGTSQPVGVQGFSIGGYGVAAHTENGTALYSSAQGTGSAGYFTSAFSGPVTGGAVIPANSASVAIYNTNSATNANGYQNGTAPQGLYVESDGLGGTGILGTVQAGDNPYEFGIGIWGVIGPGSDVAGNVRGYVSAAGVWGDSVGGNEGSPGYYGVVGTTDNNSAGYFENNSTDYSTLKVINIAPSGNAGTGLAATRLFTTLQASTPYGTCGFGGKGDLTCTGQVKTLTTTSKSRTVETYAMQSPENWMEDFGSGTVTNGVGTVAIDPAFAETANTGDEYHVFLTPNGDSKGLYVTGKTATGFEVRESGGGTSSLGFDYRIVAKRAGYESARLKDVTEQVKELAEQEAQMRHSATPENPAQKAPIRPGSPIPQWRAPAAAPGTKAATTVSSPKAKAAGVK